MKHTIKWFIDRIGNRIYRKQLTCRCKSCTDVAHNGVLVRDKYHAEYLYMVSRDIGFDYSDEQFIC